MRVNYGEGYSESYGEGYGDGYGAGYDKWRGGYHFIAHGREMLNEDACSGGTLAKVYSNIVD